jgi:hypothetical protein
VVEVRDPSIQRRDVSLGVEFNNDEDPKLGVGREVSQTAALTAENQQAREQGGNPGMHD